jgi:hypothetical protein
MTLLTLLPYSNHQLIVVLAVLVGGWAPCGRLSAPGNIAEAVELSAGVKACVAKCVETPAPVGHFECCNDPVTSSFQKPSCATGCLIDEYAADLAGCNKMCEEASDEAAGCTYTIPDGPKVAMCGSCNCGKDDCPTKHPEPENCKDPGSCSDTDPPSCKTERTCGWVDRCRGSLEGCKKGCAFHHADPNPTSAGWIFTILLMVFAGLYVGGGIAYGQRSGRGQGFAAHPHRHRWVELHGLIRDGLGWTRWKLLDGRTKTTQYTPIRGVVKGHKNSSPRSAKSASPGSVKSDSPRSKNKARKEKNEKKEKKSSKSRSGAVGGSGGQIASSPPSTQASRSTSAVEREWQPTRSTHLSSGARETGVKVDNR